MDSLAFSAGTWSRLISLLCVALAAGALLFPGTVPAAGPDPEAPAAVEASSPTGSAAHHGPATPDYASLLFVFLLATIIGIGVIGRVSRLLHTPLMSITNAISAIAVVGSVLVAGGDYPNEIRVMGAIALFASMTNIVSGFLITQRMLKMFKDERKGGQP
ncbi:MAG TPA: NAD(P) transhydrogenase subunit alpha [Thermoanaerobaculia bacterium]|nr:NAD(P) transhydrogenase subunit alpha [Thermoanaerobaculia bacterium]